MAKREEPRRVPDDLCANAAIASVNIKRTRPLRLTVNAGAPRLRAGPSLEWGKHEAPCDPPPPGRRWVRYGSDLLLVNVRNRRVEDVIYGVFY